MRKVEDTNKKGGCTCQAFLQELLRSARTYLKRSPLQGTEESIVRAKLAAERASDCKSLTEMPIPRIWVAGTLRARSRALLSLAKSTVESVKRLSVTLLLTLSQGPCPRNLIGSGAFPFLRLSFRLIHFPFTLASSIRVCTSPARIVHSKLWSRLGSGARHVQCSLATGSKALKRPFLQEVMLVCEGPKHQ